MADFFRLPALQKLSSRLEIAGERDRDARGRGRVPRKNKFLEKVFLLAGYLSATNLIHRIDAIPDQCFWVNEIADGKSVPITPRTNTPLRTPRKRHSTKI